MLGAILDAINIVLSVTGVLQNLNEHNFDKELRDSICRVDSIVSDLQDRMNRLDRVSYHCQEIPKQVMDRYNELVKQINGDKYYSRYVGLRRTANGSWLVFRKRKRKKPSILRDPDGEFKNLYCDRL